MVRSDPSPAPGAGAEADSPVANMSGCSFTSCQIQWSGQFPHEDSLAAVGLRECRRKSLTTLTHPREL